MKDIEKVKEILKNDNITCVLCRNDRIYTSEKSGISPMLDFLTARTDLRHFCAADKIIGKAAALLFALAGVDEVYGEVVSRAALPVLLEHGITVSYGVLTDVIMNRRGDGICPMEKTVTDINSPEDAFQKLLETRERLMEKK